MMADRNNRKVKKVRNMEKFDNNGYDEMSGLYKSRYYASKAKTDDNDVVVKVCGGFKIMDAYEYAVWKEQK